jgi:hypothetical protein
MLVSVGDKQKLYMWNISYGHDAQSDDWLQGTLQFTARQSLSSLSFQSKDGVGHCGAVVAGVAVMEKV